MIRVAEPTQEQMRDLIVAYALDHLDLSRISKLIRSALTNMPDDRAFVMLTRGAEWRIRPIEGDYLLLFLAYSEFAEGLSIERSVLWDEEPVRPPALGSAEREETMNVAAFPSSLLLAVPTG